MSSTMFCFNTWRSGSQNYYFSGFKTIMLIFRCFSSRAGPFPWPFLVLLWSTWTYPLLPPARWNSVGDGTIDGYDDDVGQIDQRAQSEQDVFSPSWWTCSSAPSAQSSHPWASLPPWDLHVHHRYHLMNDVHIHIRHCDRHDWHLFVSSVIFIIIVIFTLCLSFSTQVSSKPHRWFMLVLAISAFSVLQSECDWGAGQIYLNLLWYGMVWYSHWLFWQQWWTPENDIYLHLRHMRSNRLVIGKDHNEPKDWFHFL